MPRPLRRVAPVAVSVVLAASALAATSGPSGAAPPRHRAVAAPVAYAQPSPGAWAWDKSSGEGVSGGFKVKAGASGKPPTVTKIQYTVVEENNGYYCPPVGTTVKVKGSFKLHKATKYAQNPGAVYAPWTLSKKDAAPDEHYDGFKGIIPAKATVQWGGSSYRAEVAMYFDRDRPGKPFESYGGLVWYVDDPKLPGSCGYFPDAKPRK